MKLFLIIVLFCLLALASCRPPIVYEKELSKHDFVIAKVDTLFEITLPQLYDSIVTSDILPRGGILKASEVKYVLDSLLCDTLAGLASSSIKLDDYYNEFRLYRLRYYNSIIQALLKKNVYDKVTIDSMDVADFYHSRPDIYSIDEQVMLFHILISPIGLMSSKDSLHYRSLSPEQLAGELEDHAYNVYQLIQIGMPFGQVASEYSHDTFSGKNGGEVGWTKRGVYLPPFDSVAFSLEEGVPSHPYMDRDGWHIIMTPMHMLEGPPPFDTIAYSVAKKDLANYKANEIGKIFLDSLRSLPVEIVYNEPILDTNVYKVDPLTWVAIINGTDTLDVNKLRGQEESFRVNNRITNTTRAMKLEMLAALSSQIIMVQVARDLKIDTLPEVVADEYNFRQWFSKSIYERDRFDHGWQPDESMVQDYYDKHIDEFTVEKPLEIQHIIAEDSIFAEFLRDQAMSGVDFLQLAQQYYPGEEGIRKDLANLGQVGPGEVPDKLYRAGLMTLVGEVSYPVKTEFGYHIVKVVNRTDLITLSKAYYNIVPILKEQHGREIFEQYRDRLYEQLNVKFPNKPQPIHLKPLEYRSSKL